jgi:hypothetical protein
MEPIQNMVDAEPGSFGFDEATRKFRLPAPSGRPEINVYASRSTIDTSLLTVFSGNVFDTNGTSLDRQDEQEDVTVNQDVGVRMSFPLAVKSENFQATLSGGFDFKTYDAVVAIRSRDHSLRREFARRLRRDRVWNRHERGLVAFGLSRQYPKHHRVAEINRLLGDAYAQPLARFHHPHKLGADPARGWAMGERTIDQQ